MSNLLFTINAILPIILPILVGYFLKRINFFKDDFLIKANKLVFAVFIPILLFSNLYLADLRLINFKFILFIIISILILFIIGVIVSKAFSDTKQKGVITQAAFRSNYAIIGIPLATMLGGEISGAYAAIVAAISVPMFNILAVISLTMFSDYQDKSTRLKKTFKKIITNPLIIGVFLGLVCCGINTLIGINNVKSFLSGPNSQTHGMKFIYDTISSLAKVSTPLSLIILGGRFEFSAVKRLIPHLTFSVTFKLIITPLIILFVAYLLKFRSVSEFAILIALFATPVAVSSVPMASEMGQDDILAGQIVVWTSTISMLTLFIIIFICSAINIL